MKKRIFLWISIITFTIVTFVFVACGKESDSEVDTPIGSIIGTWRNDWGSGPRDYTAYSFFEDGTGLMFDKGNGARFFNYTYNSNSQSVKIVYSEYDNDQLSISKQTSGMLVMDSDEYKKSELTYNMLILGEWFMNVDARNSFGKGTRVLFSADWEKEGTGTFEAKDYYNDDVMDEWDYSFYGLKGKVGGTWSINGNKISITGNTQIAGEYIIDGLVVNGCRLIRASHPDEYPYLIGGWENR
jgi:hypothetical protein